MKNFLRQILEEGKAYELGMSTLMATPFAVCIFATRRSGEQSPCVAVFSVSF